MFSSLSLQHFRNFSDLELEFAPQVNIFLGHNGQGKTNLLEALSLLSSGESFRYSENENLVQKNQTDALLNGKFLLKDLDFDLRLQINKSRKQHFVNSKRISTTELFKQFYFVVFSPESLTAIKGGADQRRQLLDELLVSSDPLNARILADFRKALKSRNRILKDYKEQLTAKKTTEELLQSLNPSFFRLAADLSLARIAAINAVESQIFNAMNNITRENKPVRLSYVISGQQAVHFSHQDIHNLMQKRAAELYAAELASGTSLVGPQKHDVVFLYDENDSRFFASQGQQRALILSFKMAQIVYHRRVHGVQPILMLDDVLSELDEVKREALIRFLQEIKTQIFMTTTDLKLTGDLASQDCRVMEIANGKIR